jgi:hypothetical protein
METVEQATASRKISHPVNEVLSPELQVTPLAKGETAVYKLKDYGKIDGRRHDEQNNPLPIEKPYYGLAPMESVYDPFQQQRVIIKCIRAIEPAYDKQGRGFNREVFQKPRFSNGEVRVSDSDGVLYAFMERSNFNLSNPYRDPSVLAVFYREDKAKELQNIIATEETQLDARLLVRDGDYNDLKQFAHTIMERGRYTQKFDISDPGALRAQMIKFAQMAPREVLIASSKPELMMKLIITDLEEFKIIQYHIDRGKCEWRWSDARGGDLILEIPSGDDKYNSAVALLREGKIKDYRKIEAALRNAHMELFKGLTGKR